MTTQTTSQTTTEAASEIRKALKKEGITSRQVSVRAEYYSMGSSINIKVKVRGVDIEAVKRIAGEYERVSRCDMTGDILSGGNRFVHVDYDFSLISAAAEEVMQECADAFKQMQSDQGRAVEVRGVKLVMPLNGRDIREVGTDSPRSIYPGVNELAHFIAHRIVEQAA